LIDTGLAGVDKRAVSQGGMAMDMRTGMIPSNGCDGRKGSSIGSYAKHITQKLCCQSKGENNGKEKMYGFASRVSVCWWSLRSGG
jgi:hypothetical protein